MMDTTDYVMLRRAEDRIKTLHSKAARRRLELLAKAGQKQPQPSPLSFTIVARLLGLTGK